MWYIEPSTEPTTLEQEIALGLRANAVQAYDEMNKKRGLQWEASREIVATLGGKYYSVLRAGANFPIDMKSRVLSATGAGLIARVYRITASDYTGGTPEPMYSMRPGMNTTLEGQLLTGINLVTPVTSLIKRGADLFLRVNAQGAQGGFTPSDFGSNRIIEINDRILLEIESLGDQTISSRIEIYEGPLDFPRP